MYIYMPESFCCVSDTNSTVNQLYFYFFIFKIGDFFLRGIIQIVNVTHKCSTLKWGKQGESGI